MTFESYPKSTSMREPNYEQSEKYSIANDDYTVFSVIPLGLRNTPLRITRFRRRVLFGTRERVTLPRRKVMFTKKCFRL